MAITLTSDQSTLKAAFVAFFSDANTTTVAGNKIDKTSLSFFVDLGGTLFARANVVGAPSTTVSTFNAMSNPFKVAPKVVAPQVTASPSTSCVWTMKGVCLGNAQLNLANVLPRT